MNDNAPSPRDHLPLTLQQEVHRSCGNTWTEFVLYAPAEYCKRTNTPAFAVCKSIEAAEMTLRAITSYDTLVAAVKAAYHLCEGGPVTRDEWEAQRLATIPILTAALSISSETDRKEAP